jgi:uncharacterized protein
MTLKVEIKDCKLGKGVFAVQDISEGELIFFVNGRLVTYEEGLTLPCGGDHTVQIGSDLYINPQPPSKYINHSCDPNSGIRDDLAIVAIRHIKSGEEVSFDYSTCVLERSFRMKCECGFKDCRKWIGDFDEIPDELKLKYIRLGIVQPFIMDEYFNTRRRSVIAETYRNESARNATPSFRFTSGSSSARPGAIQPLAPLGKL